MQYEDVLDAMNEEHEGYQEQLDSCDCAGDAKDPDLYCDDCVEALNELNTYPESVAEYMAGELNI